MKPENKFRTWFIDKFAGWVNQAYPHWRIVTKKHADYATSGTLDMSIAINGITVWVEFKLIPSMKEHRKLDVSAIQRAELAVFARAGVPCCVVVGLPLGPRKGYDVALYHSVIPEECHRDHFGSLERAFNQLAGLAVSASIVSRSQFGNVVIE